MHIDILNYTKLALNSLKMIQNDTVYQPIKQGMIGLFNIEVRMLKLMFLFEETVDEQFSELSENCAYIVK